ncbi:MAG: PAS domain S-box protein [Bacteroidota bacterium]
MNASPISFIPWPAMLVRKDNFEIIEANGPATELTGMMAAKLPGMDAAMFFPDKQIVPMELEHVLFRDTTGKSFQVELNVQTCDETALPCYILTCRKRERQFQDLMEGVVDGIIITDKKLNILDVNPAFCSIAEMKREEAVGSNGFDLARKFATIKNLSKIIPALKQMASGRSVSQFEIEYRGKNVSISTKIRKDSSSYIGIVRDISKEKEAQQALRESEEKFRFFAESSFEGIVVHNRGVVLDANDAFLQITGYTREEGIGQNLLDYIPKSSDKARVLANMLKKRTKPFHVGARKKDGSRIVVEIEAKDVRYLGKKVRLAAIRDVTKQIILQQQLKESEERYRSFFENSATANIIFEADRTISLTNSKFAKLVGYPKEEIENKMKWTKFVAPEDLERLHHWHELRLKDPALVPDEYEFRLVDHDNNIKYTNLFADVISGTEQSIASLVDITDRKKAQQIILESESKLKKAQSIAKMGYWNINLTTGEATGSLQTRKIYGLTVESLSLEKIQKIPLPEYREQLDKALRDLIDGTGIYDIEFKVKNQESGQILDVRSIAEYNPEENFITGVIQDVTRMKEAESQIHHGEQYLKSIFRAAPVGIGVVVNRTITGVNEKLCELTGYSEEELLDQPARMLYMSDNDYEYVGREKYGQIARKGTGTIETRWKCKDGSVRDILLSSTPIDAGDPLRGVTFTAMDITERKKAEQDLIAKNQELIQARDKAEESDRLKTAFLTNMSHEIRTPMNGILGFTSLLENPSLSTETMNYYIDIIKKSGERLLGTVNDLIDISKLEAGLVKIVISDTYINELLDTLYNFFEREAHAKGLRISCVKTIQNQQVRIRADEQKLNSVLTNLVKNAIKYTHKGSVEFGYRGVTVKNKPMLEFYTRDTGIGIPADRQQAVFNRFEQADIEDSNVYEGSGLGLAIAKSLVEMMGGEIWLKSEVDKGTTFFFTIPLLVSEGKEPISLDAKPARGNEEFPGGLKILIAEDDVASFVHLSILIKDRTREVLHVTTGTDAVKMCQDHPDIDLVLMDIKMPDMTGLEATRRIREFNPSLPIIAQTAYAMPGDREKALEAGCNDHITKPIIREDLMEKLALHMV